MIYTYVFTRGNALQRVGIIPVSDEDGEIYCDIFIGDIDKKFKPLPGIANWSKRISKNILDNRETRKDWIIGELENAYQNVKLTNAKQTEFEKPEIKIVSEKIEVPLQIKVNQSKKLFNKNYDVLNMYCVFKIDLAKHDKYTTEISVFPCTENGEKQKVFLKRDFTLKDIEDKASIMLWLSIALEKDLGFF